MLFEPHQVEMSEPLTSNGVVVVPFQVKAPLNFELVHLYLFGGILFEIKKTVGVSIPSLAIDVNILLIKNRFGTTLFLAFFNQFLVMPLNGFKLFDELLLIFVKFIEELFLFVG